MDFKDYYEILGVPSNAEKKVIQQTFRKLARKYHPDVNPGDKEAEEKFKTINEAHQVLSDTEKRKKFDELRAQYQQWQHTGGRQQDFDWQNCGLPNLGKELTNTAILKTWKTSLEAHRRIPTSSTISLARHLEAEAVKALHPDHAADVMSNTK